MSEEKSLNDLLDSLTPAGRAEAVLREYHLEASQRELIDHTYIRSSVSHFAETNQYQKACFMIDAVGLDSWVDAEYNERLGNSSETSKLFEDGKDAVYAEAAELYEQAGLFAKAAEAIAKAIDVCEESEDDFDEDLIKEYEERLNNYETLAKRFENKS